MKNKNSKPDLIFSIIFNSPFIGNGKDTFMEFNIVRPAQDLNNLNKKPNSV